MTDNLHLKFGKPKSWNLSNSPEAQRIMDEYMEEDNPEKEKELICGIIDNVNGTISDWWTGNENVSKEDAKKYVTEYGN